MFTGLTGLDGYRKNVKMECNMKDALPEEEKVEADYDTSNIEWYDQTGTELTKVNPAAERFQDGHEVKREENTLSLLLKDYKKLLDSKKNILTY